MSAAMLGQSSPPGLLPVKLYLHGGFCDDEDLTDLPGTVTLKTPSTSRSPSKACPDGKFHLLPDGEVYGGDVDEVGAAPRLRRKLFRHEQQYSLPSAAHDDDDDVGDVDDEAVEVSSFSVLKALRRAAGDEVELSPSTGISPHLGTTQEYASYGELTAPVSWGSGHEWAAADCEEQLPKTEVGAAGGSPAPGPRYADADAGGEACFLDVSLPLEPMSGFPTLTTLTEEVLERVSDAECWHRLHKQLSGLNSGGMGSVPAQPSKWTGGPPGRRYGLLDAESVGEVGRDSDADAWASLRTQLASMTEGVLTIAERHPDLLPRGVRPEAEGTTRLQDQIQATELNGQLARLQVDVQEMYGHGCDVVETSTMLAQHMHNLERHVGSACGHVTKARHWLQPASTPSESMSAVVRQEDVPTIGIDTARRVAEMLQAVETCARRPQLSERLRAVGSASFVGASGYPSHSAHMMAAPRLAVFEPVCREVRGASSGSLPPPPAAFAASATVPLVMTPLPAGSLMRVAAPVRLAAAAVANCRGATPVRQVEHRVERAPSYGAARGLSPARRLSVGSAGSACLTPATPFYGMATPVMSNHFVEGSSAVLDGGGLCERLRC